MAAHTEAKEIELFKYRDRRSTGIHVGDGGLQVVELRLSGKAAVLEGALRLNIHELPFPLPWVDPTFQHVIADTIRNARRQHGVRFRRPYFALDERSATVKRRELLPGKVQDNRDNLEWEARQFLAADLEAYAVDYLLTSEYGFVVAARRAAMDRVRGVCQHAGIPKPEFDLAPFALYNALEASSGLLSSGCELLLDVGVSTARSVLLVEGQLRWVGMVRARRLTTFANGSGEAALDAATLDEDSAAAEDDSATAQESPQSDFDEWMDTLARGAEKLVHAELGAMHVDRCWLSGNYATQAQEPLARRLGLAVQLMDPFSRIDTGTQELDEPTAFAIATGLALRGISES